MRLAIAVAGLCASSVAGGCIAGVPRCCALIVPARYDVGAVVASDRRPSGVHVALGGSAASWASDPETPYDVGLGYVIDVRRSETPAMDKVAGSTEPRLGAVTFGGYLEGAVRIAASRHQRSFFGLRAELVENDPDGHERYGFGLTARLAWELVRAGRGRNWMGALAAGVFVEAATRRFSDDLSEHTVVTGVSFRVPAIFVPLHHRSE
jgi:hypothetical protein